MAGQETVFHQSGVRAASPAHRYGGAPVRGLALTAIALLGLVLLPIAGIGLLLSAVRPVLAVRRLPVTARGLADAWSGVDIGDPYLPEPAAPRRREDGRYRHGRRLYESARLPLRLRRARQVVGDPATRRDLAWLLLNPVVGGPIAVLPAALVGTGLLAVIAPLWWPGAGFLSGFAQMCSLGTGQPAMAVAVGVATLLAGSAAGPGLLALHGRWTRILLAARPVDAAKDERWARGRRRVQALGAGALLTVLAGFGLLLATLQLVALAVAAPTGALAVLYLKAVTPARALANACRGLSESWGGVPMPVPYRPRPADPERGADGFYEYRRTLHSSPYLPKWLRLRDWVLADPATWRDLLWLLVNPLAAAVLLLTPLLVAAVAVAGIAVPGVQHSLFGISDRQNTWATVVRRLPAGEAITGSWALALPVCLLLVVLACWVAPATLRAHAGLNRLLLAPTTRARLTTRVARLTETRADATGVQAAELRRIERDLHDGAQARLVAIGMTLRAVERRLGGDWDEVREMVADARANSAGALADLRDLVRGIHPPVLAERGLADAVRALALDVTQAVTVTVELPGRADPPVEACAYFAISEALTNAAKHSGAAKARVDLRHRGGALLVTVSDDGRGGADLTLGTGLRGIQRRLGTFDGTLEVTSPPGGPTMLTMELPCALSSPRISTF